MRTASDIGIEWKFLVKSRLVYSLTKKSDSYIVVVKFESRKMLGNVESSLDIIWNFEKSLNANGKW